MGKNLLILLISLCAISAKAQDKIYLKSGKNVEAKILEVNVEDVKYKMFSYLDGPTFTVLKTDIQIVIYQNGESQIFEEKKTSKDRARVLPIGSNRINLDFLSIAYNGPSYMSYEKISKSKRIGYEIPFNIHYINGEGIVGVSTGFNAKFYVSGNAKGFYIGPTIAIGAFEFYRDDFDFNNNWDSYAEAPGLIIGFKLGGQFQLTKVFGLSTSTSLGYMTPLENASNLYGDVAFSLNFGANFTF